MIIKSVRHSSFKILSGNFHNRAILAVESIQNFFGVILRDNTFFIRFGSLDLLTNCFVTKWSKPWQSSLTVVSVTLKTSTSPHPTPSSSPLESQDIRRWMWNAAQLRAMSEESLKFPFREVDFRLVIRPSYQFGFKVMANLADSNEKCCFTTSLQASNLQWGNAI